MSKVVAKPRNFLLKLFEPESAFWGSAPFLSHLWAISKCVRAGGVAQWLEYSSSMHKVLGSIPSTTYTGYGSTCL